MRRYSLEGGFRFAQFESLQTPQPRGGHLPTAQPLQPPFLVGPTYCHPVPIPGTLRPHATRPLKATRALQMHGFILGPNIFQIHDLMYSLKKIVWPFLRSLRSKEATKSWNLGLILFYYISFILAIFNLAIMWYVPFPTISGLKSIELATSKKASHIFSKITSNQSIYCRD